MTIAKRARRSRKRTRANRGPETREFCLGLLDWMQEMAEEVLDEVAGMRVDIESACNSDFGSREDTEKPFLFYSNPNTEHTTNPGQENDPIGAS